VPLTGSGRQPSGVASGYLQWEVALALFAKSRKRFWLDLFIQMEEIKETDPFDMLNECYWQFPFVTLEPACFPNTHLQ